ncbi:MAG: tyrosine-type recombinase/integrase [Thermodesulfobacteriota bacterium]
MAVYQRGKNWYIDFTFHGKRIREMIGPSRKDAEKVIAKRKTQINEDTFLDKRKEPEPIEFHSFAVKYLKWAKGNKAKNSYLRDLTSMKHLDKEFEKRNILEITQEEVEEYYAKRKEISIYSANRELALLKHFYTKAIEWKRVKENPTKAVKVRLKDETQRVRFLMPNEIQILLSCCPDNLKPIVMVALHTGMRREEILSLRWTQVNLTTGIIHLDKTKNHKSRNVKMNVTVRSVLCQVCQGSEFVFCKPDGSRYSKVPGPFDEVVKQAGLKDFHFHDLRHTFASNLIMAGVSILVVKELLGHKKLDMTLRYAHLAPNYGDAVNILDSIMSPSPESPQEKEGFARA